MQFFFIIIKKKDEKSSDESRKISQGDESEKKIKKNY